MYTNPKNSYEFAMNSIYKAAEPAINNRTYVGLEPIAANLEAIYRNLPEEFQIKFGDNFYDLLCLTETEE